MQAVIEIKTRDEQWTKLWQVKKQFKERKKELLEIRKLEINAIEERRKAADVTLLLSTGSPKNFKKTLSRKNSQLTKLTKWGENLRPIGSGALRLVQNRRRGRIPRPLRTKKLLKISQVLHRATPCQEIKSSFSCKQITCDR